MRFENNTNEAILKLERQRTAEIYEDAGEYRCDHGCVGYHDLFFVGEYIFCEKCVVEYLRSTVAEIIELAKLTKGEDAEVLDLLVDIIDDMCETELINYAEYYYSRAK